MSLRFQLSLNNVQLPLGFVELFTKAFKFMLFLLYFHPVSALYVFLDFHAHDVCVDRQSHLVGHLVNFALLLFDGTPHIAQASFKTNLQFFAGLHFFAETFLEGDTLATHLLVVELEVVVEGVDLLFFGKSGLQMAFNGRKCSL